MVAVIGAGVIGAAIAESLVARGASVTLFEMRHPGAGASQASAGVLCPYVEAKPGSPLLALGVRSLSMWDPFVESLNDRASGRVFEYRRTGTLEVAQNDADAGHLEAQARWLGSEGVSHDWLTGAALRAFEPQVTPAAVAGLAVHGHGFVDVSALVEALLHAARLQGAVCVTPREVLHVTPGRDHVDIEVDGRTERFTHIVIATGSWTRRVRVDGLPVFPIKPIRGQLLRLRPGTASPARSVWSSRCYTVPWADGSLLVGATVEDVGFDERATAAGVRELLEAVCALLPSTSAASFEGVRVGLRPATADHLPLLGPWPHQPRVILAAGHYRNGILLAPLTADIVTRLIIEGERDPVCDVTDPARFR